MNNYIIPIIIFLIVIYSYKKINIYEAFIKGVKEGMSISLNLFPSILAIIFASRIIISSGFIDFILNLLSPLLSILKLPKEVITLSFLRPISFNASLSMMLSVYDSTGVDSYLSFLASIIQGCMDTTLYITTLYYGIIGIKKIKHSLKLSLFVNLISIILAIIFAKLFF